ncbi:MAG: helix-turn-helix domain-containing protein [Treponema sp.]|jgi:AraC-like DNA-binding protein|nr:helix-turn-helix domain-containing protein [Treponema sp.]
MAIESVETGKTLHLLGEAAQAWGVNIRFYGPEPRGLEDFDGGIRSRLFQKNSAARPDSKTVKVTARSLSHGMVDMLEDALKCHYCLFRLPGEERYCVIGPWIVSHPGDEGIDALLLRCAIPPHLRPELVHYYEWLPLVYAAGNWEKMIMLFVQDLYGADTTIRMHTMFLGLGASGEFYTPKPEAVLSMKILEERYKNENAILEAIAEGNSDKALRALAGFRISFMENRIPSDRLRNTKNYLVILNTLARKAAEQGFVHPIHIDVVSSEFSREIEAASAVSELNSLAPKMLRGYCRLVKEYSMQNYTPVIRDIITVIEYHVQEPLSLHYLAARFNINPSYLSALFKRETGETITSFINNRRIRLAGILLRDTALRIQDAAEQCGFLDINYFNRLFKRHYGKTPRDFRRELHKPVI